LAVNRALSKYLKELSQEELVDEINRLYTRFPLVRDYYIVELGSDNGQLLSKYKKQMAKLFKQGLNFVKVDINTCNKVVKDFSSISVHPSDTIDLKLYKVE
jgi:hypothetical protein